MKTAGRGTLLTSSAWRVSSQLLNPAFIRRLFALLLLRILRSGTLAALGVHVIQAPFRPLSIKRTQTEGVAVDRYIWNRPRPRRSQLGKQKRELNSLLEPDPRFLYSFPRY